MASMLRQYMPIQAVPSACSIWPPVGNGALRSNTPILSRLIGDFNQSFNIVATLATLPLPNPTFVITQFPGITFSDVGPFVAPANSQILMPATFQLSFQTGTLPQAVAGDDLRVWFTLGYDVEPKTTRF